MSLKHFWYRLKYHHGKHLPIDIPVDVSLELASSCNMRCTYCYHSDQDNLPFTRGIMSWEIAEKIILEAYQLGVNSLKMNWKGESTLNPHFRNICELAQELATGSTFMERISNSNFQFDTKRDDIFLGFCAQTKVKVSYDSFDALVFNSQRAGGKHEIVTRNIDKFYNYGGRGDTELVIQAVRTELNKNEDIEHKCKKRWPSATVSIRDMVEGRVTKDLGHLATKNRDKSKRQACKQAFVRLIFNSEGKAFPCCPDVGEELCLGNIRTNDLYEIFNSVEAIKLRNMLKTNRAFALDPCRTCSSYETYKGYRPAWGS